MVSQARRRASRGIITCSQSTKFASGSRCQDRFAYSGSNACSTLAGTATANAISVRARPSARQSSKMKRPKP